MSKNKSDVLSDIMTLTDLSVMTRLIRAGLVSVLSTDSMSVVLSLFVVDFLP